MEITWSDAQITITHTGGGGGGKVTEYVLRDRDGKIEDFYPKSSGVTITNIETNIPGMKEIVEQLYSNIPAPNIHIHGDEQVIKEFLEVVQSHNYGVDWTITENTGHLITKGDYEKQMEDLVLAYY